VVSIQAGFTWADIPYTGPSIAVSHEPGAEARAKAIARELIDEMWRRRDLPERDAESIRALVSQRDAVCARARDLLPESIDAVKIRHHGDLHLGQMLVVKDDVFIIDFEGEPRRTVERRRLKAAAARDIAGLVRSIDYSAGAALARALGTAPDEDGRVARALERWRDLSVSAALAAYHENMSDPRLWPADQAPSGRLLDFFLLEKVLYEIEYELAHRPDWLRVPLAGLARLMLSAGEEVPA